MFQQTQNNLISTRQINNRSLENELDTEIFIDLVRQFPVIWDTRLNGFKYSVESMYSFAKTMLFNCRYTS